MVNTESLTAEQRIGAYRYCMDHTNDRSRPWVCVHLMEYCHSRGIDISDEILNYFPEFARYKPEKLPFENSTMWWVEDEAGINRRKEVLNECIEECLLLINQTTE